MCWSMFSEGIYDFHLVLVVSTHPLKSLHSSIALWSRAFSLSWNIRDEWQLRLFQNPPRRTECKLNFFVVVVWCLCKSLAKFLVCQTFMSSFFLQWLLLQTGGCDHDSVRKQYRRVRVQEERKQRQSVLWGRSFVHNSFMIQAIDISGRTWQAKWEAICAKHWLKNFMGDRNVQRLEEREDAWPVMSDWDLVV